MSRGEADYFFFFALPLTDAAFGLGLTGDFRAGFGAGFGATFTGLDFSGGFPLAAGFTAASAGGAGGTAAPGFPFFPAFAAALSGTPAATAASAVALAPRPRRGGGGGGGGGGAKGFRNFRVSVRERNLPSSRSMKTSRASLG